MKKYLLFIAVIAVIAGCSKKEVTNDNPVDIFNGYGHLKSSNPTATLWAGKNTDVGTVTYGIEEIGGIGYFTATYDLTGGWTMSESHLYAGSYDDMPLNKPGNPKIGRFPYAENHSPKVSTYTYQIPADDLPPYQCPEDEVDGNGDCNVLIGFTTAAHAVVHGPNGQEETAWRADDNDFPGKRWGWFGTFYIDMPAEEDRPVIIFGTHYGDDGTLNVTLINVTSGTATHIISDDIDIDEVNFDGTAYDQESGYFFFTGAESSTLYGINLNDDSNLETLGTLSVPTQSATYYNNNYYYVDGNNLMEVSFDDNMQVVSTSTAGTISADENITSVTGITVDVATNTMYMVGNVNDGTTTLIAMDMINTSDINYIDVDLNQNSQISFGSDGVLYVVEVSDDGTESFVRSIHPQTGNISDTEENGLDDVFSDLAGGPMLM